MQYIAALERKGFLNRHARKARALITPAMKRSGSPTFQFTAKFRLEWRRYGADHRGARLLDTRSANMLKNRKTFALRVRGDSMISAHIVDGDIAIGRQESAGRRYRWRRRLTEKRH